VETRFAPKRKNRRGIASTIDVWLPGLSQLRTDFTGSALRSAAHWKRKRMSLAFSVRWDGDKGNTKREFRNIGTRDPLLYRLKCITD
jgi:hypothetical protein